MAAHTKESYYYSGQGVVMMGELDADTGKVKKLLPIGNVSALAIAISTTRNEHRESQTGARGTDRVITTEVGAAVNMTIENLIQENLAIGLYGTTAEVAASSQEVSVNVTAELGYITALEAIKVKTVVVKDKGGTPNTYEADKNYRLNSETGSIYWMTAEEQTEAGATNPIADATELTITYQHEAFKQLEGLTSSAAPTRFLRFEGLNTVEGDAPVVVDIFKFESSPLAEYALINEEISGIAVEGTALADTSRTTGSKYFRQRSLK